MARVANGMAQKSGNATVNGMHEPTAGSPSPMRIEIDGQVLQLPGSLGSHHVASYIAALFALADADADGVTDLTVQTPANLLRNQVTGQWRVENPLLKSLHQGVLAMQGHFDSVTWP